MSDEKYEVITLDKNTTNEADIKRFILERASKDLGPEIITYQDTEMKTLSKKASTICRRRFKASDVLLMSLLDEEAEGETGVAFTADGIYHWEEDDNFIFGIKYRDIKQVDYDSNGVIVKIAKTEDAQVQDSAGMSQKPRNIISYTTETAGVIPCTGYDQYVDEDEEQNYIREMYNFIADIVDEIS